MVVSVCLFVCPFVDMCMCGFLWACNQGAYVDNLTDAVDWPFLECNYLFYLA